MSKYQFSNDVSPDLKPGEYQLNELIHYVWDIVMSLEPNYAKRFKKAAMAGQVRGVRWLGQSPDGRDLYELRPGRAICPTCGRR